MKATRGRLKSSTKPRRLVTLDSELANALISRVLSGDKADSETAFGEICTYLEPGIRCLLKVAWVRGMDTEDIRQECLYALRFKAIPNYDPKRGESFLGFALFVIRRHIWTLVIHSTTQVRRTLNFGIQMTLLQEGHDPNSMRADLFIDTKAAQPTKEIEQREENRLLCKEILKQLTDLEYIVLEGTARGLSYKEVRDYILLKHPTLAVSVKGVDNALCRARAKAHAIVQKRKQLEAERE
ncbi:MAG: hypothetical protein KF678_03530 [Phycisphaeraceae bacterium]|nr:hypothetical protein [Phycisphaeraceae bacterium]